KIRAASFHFCPSVIPQKAAPTTGASLRFYGPERLARRAQRLFRSKSHSAAQQMSESYPGLVKMAMGDLEKLAEFSELSSFVCLA
ncbi:MAG TPA: hypothetical protein VGO50_14890, partial [Pyrinomonadaceae bacterium]|nr:hypothetical protein [Pyrinomonadaceae bacterium]